MTNIVSCDNRYTLNFKGIYAFLPNICRENQRRTNLTAMPPPRAMSMSSVLRDVTFISVGYNLLCRGK